MTVNHDVAGSSPAVGAKTKNHPIGWFFVLASVVDLGSTTSGLTATPFAD